MRKKLAIVYGCILPTYLILIGCTPPIHITESPHVITPSQVMTVATPSALSIQAATPTLTVIPTLPINQANLRLLELLANNGKCRLPCVWGITPGESTNSDALNILIPLSGLSSFTDLSTSPGDISPTYAEGDNILFTRMAFPFTESGLISHIAFQAGILSKKTPLNGEFDKRIEYYMLPNILSQYGSPTTVMLSTMAKLPSSGVPGGFKVLLLYPDQGILVNYTMQMQIAGENIMGCPSNVNAEFELYPPGQPDSFFDFLGPSGWAQIIRNTYKPLEEATSMSQNDFFLIFKKPTEECILTPSNLWPVPD